MKSKVQFNFEAIGTSWVVDLKHIPDTFPPAEIERAIKARIELFDQDYSRFRSDSLVSEISRSAGHYQMPDDAETLMALYRLLYEITDGAFTPMIGSVLEAAGYDAAYSLDPRKVRAPLPWEEALDFRNPELIVHHPVILDFGAAGKGYLVDLIGDLLDQFEISSFCIDAGGDILHESVQSEILRVGLEDPSDVTKVIGVALLENGSICGSSGNRRAWGSYHHIVDPRTLTSPRHLLATWVIAPTAMIADALATCLFLAPAQMLALHFDFEYAAVYPDHSFEKSAGFPVELFY